MNIKRADFGKWLQEKREDALLSQMDVAKKISISKACVGQWEIGIAPVPIEKLFDLAELYGMDMKDVVEKLKENDPGIADRFGALAIRFAKYHLGLMTNNRPGDARQHHRNKVTSYILSEQGPEYLDELNAVLSQLAVEPARYKAYPRPSCMIPQYEIKQYCAHEIDAIDPASLLDIYYIILKSYGKSYVDVRVAWIDADSRQLDLFSAVRN
jgi:transcriptional regulator with XRE-family HTH domain